MIGGRVSQYVVVRWGVLAAANVAALAAIALLLREGGSFTTVLRSLAADKAPTILAAVGLTAIIMTGAIDLSIGSIIAVAGSVFGTLVYHGQPPLVCFVACAGVTWLLLAFNGLIVRLTALPAIIVTLAGLPFYRGVALVVTDVAIPQFAGNVPVPDDAYHGPGKFYAPLLLAAALAAWFLWLTGSETPRRWLAVGENEEACRLQGLRPENIRLTAFLGGGLLLALASLIYCTQVQIIDPARLALGFELQVVGAVVLGGTRILGGEGTFFGAVLGAALLHWLEQLLIYAHISAYYREVVVGAMILVIIGGDCLLHRRQKRLEELA